MGDNLTVGGRGKGLPVRVRVPVIRAERSDEVDAIRRITSAAFGREAEARLVEALRASDAFVPELSLVADADGDVVGHLLLSYVGLAGDGTRRVLSLAPMSVRPDRQRGGIGSALVREGLRLADERGEPLVVVLGHRWFYPRFGFVPATRHGIEAPFPVRDDVFMVRTLRAYDPSLCGKIAYPPAFDDL